MPKTQPFSAAIPLHCKYRHRGTHSPKQFAAGRGFLHDLLTTSRPKGQCSYLPTSRCAAPGRCRPKGHAAIQIFALFSIIEGQPGRCAGLRHSPACALSSYDGDIAEIASIMIGVGRDQEEDVPAGWHVFFPHIAGQRRGIARKVRPSSQMTWP